MKKKPWEMFQVPWEKYAQSTSRLLWKMVENMLFLYSEHLGMGMLPQKIYYLY